MTYLRCADPGSELARGYYAHGRNENLVRACLATLAWGLLHLRRVQPLPSRSSPFGGGPRVPAVALQEMEVV